MISVCMATYNGEKYIHEQLQSILSQLPKDAEIIISDDGSSDSTREIINSFQDNRIILLEGPKKGVVRNFENALKESKGDIIFLSDQDDIWMENKVECILNAMQDPSVECVLHDAVVTDGEGNVLMPSLLKWRKVWHGVIPNLLKNSYTGCCMVFRRELLERSLPFPEKIYMHDWWIGLIAEKKKKPLFLYENLIQYRRHGENTNSLNGYSLKTKIQNRIVLIKALI